MSIKHRWPDAQALGIRMLLVFGLSAALCACAIRLVSDYDEHTDQAVTALQKKTETFLIALEDEGSAPDCLYEPHKAFYQEAKADVSALRVRAAAIPQNTISLQQIDLLSSSLESLRSLHQLKSAKPIGKNCLSAAEIEPLQTAFNSSFTAILKLELAKKRGAAP